MVHQKDYIDSEGKLKLAEEYLEKQREFLSQKRLDPKFAEDIKKLRRFNRKFLEDKMLSIISDMENNMVDEREEDDKELMLLEICYLLTDMEKEKGPRAPMGTRFLGYSPKPMDFVR